MNGSYFDYDTSLYGANGPTMQMNHMRNTGTEIFRTLISLRPTIIRGLFETNSSFCIE